MNKTIFFLILAVCILGMALILLNQRLGRDPEPRPAARAGQSVVTEAPGAESAPAFREDAAGPDAAAPAVPPMEPASAPSPADGDRRNAPAMQDAEDLQPVRDREAAGAAADALALERKEAEQALRGASQTPATPPAAPKASSATAAENAPQQATDGAQRQPAPARAAAPAKKPAEREKAATGRRAITRFVVFARETGATVRLTGNGPLRYKSMNLDNPDRVVLDLEGDWEVKAPAVPKNPLVTAVRVGDMGGRTRVVIDLRAKPRSARVIPAKNGDGVDVRVDQ